MAREIRRPSITPPPARRPPPRVVKSGRIPPTRSRPRRLSRGECPYLVRQIAPGPSFQTLGQRPGVIESLAPQEISEDPQPPLAVGRLRHPRVLFPDRLAV